jgi:hypothetical protein
MSVLCAVGIHRWQLLTTRNVKGHGALLEARLLRCQRCPRERAELTDGRGHTEPIDMDSEFVRRLRECKIKIVIGDKVPSDEED